MKTLKKTLLLAAVAVGLFSSCQKEKIEPLKKDETILEYNSATRLNNIFLNNRDEAKQVFTINASSGGTIIGAKGSKISFGANAFKNNQGNYVTGNVSVELIESLDYKDMLQLNVPTVAEENDSLKLLKSGGQVKLTATQNDEDLVLVPGSTTLEVPVTNYDNNMAVFAGEEDTEGAVTWTPADTTPVMSPTQSLTTVAVNSISQTVDTSNIWPYYYSIVIKNFGWINCDYFYNTTITTGNVVLPEGCNQYNTKVWVVFSSINSMSNCYMNDSNTLSLYGVPLGMNAKIIVLSELKENEYTYAIVPITISSNFTQAITMSSITIESFEQEVNNL